MSMDCLPTEILQMVIKQHVLSLEPGWPFALRVIKLRTLNRIFDQVVLYVLFGTDVVGKVPYNDGTWTEEKRIFLLRMKAQGVRGKTNDNMVNTVLRATDGFIKLVGQDEAKKDKSSSASHPCTDKESGSSFAGTRFVGRSFRETVIWLICGITIANAKYKVRTFENECLMKLFAAVGTGKSKILKKLLKEKLKLEPVMEMVRLIGWFDHEHTNDILLDHVTRILGTGAPMYKWDQHCVNAQRAFGQAAASGYGGTVKSILRQDMRRSHGWTITYFRDILITALGMEHVEVVRQMLAHSNPKSKFYYGFLLKICTSGSDRMIKAAVEGRRWLDPKLPQHDEVQQAALVLAVRGRTMLLAKLCPCGVQLDYCAEGVDSLLTAATKAGRLDTVKWLLGRGAKPLTVHRGALHCLIDSVSNGETSLDDATELMKALFEAGAPNVNDIRGKWTLLARAAYTGEIRLVQLLLDFGANPRRQRNGITPLLASVEAWQNGQSDDLVKLFLDLGLNPDGAQDRRFRRTRRRSRGISGEDRPLAVARKRKKEAIAQLLLRKGALRISRL